MFGPHLTVDLYGCDKDKLSSVSYVEEILSEMPGKLGMNKFSEPQVTKVPEQRKTSFDRGGITGFVILIESHMAIHTFPADGYASFDIFSCQKFDTEYAAQELVRALGAEKAEKNFIVRGKEFVKHYPRSPLKASEIAQRERSRLAGKR